MAKRIMDYEIDPLFRTPGLPRILRLRQIKAQTYMTPGERRELARLEETQQTMEFLFHRHKRVSARRKQKTQPSPQEGSYTGS
jgi:hypothetical protein